MPGSNGDHEKETELKSLLSAEVRTRLIGRVERHLDLQRWQFRLSYVHLASGRKVIYDSPRCRVKFSLFRDEREGDEIKVWYARSHVPNNVDLIMEYQGERCFAWHNIGVDPYWQFLEGYSIQEAVESRRVKAHWPAAVEFDSMDRGDLPEYADGTMAFHGYLWRRYGERLFSLFDLRQPERWEEFRRYIEEYYRLRPFKPLEGDTLPPRDQIC